MTVTIHDDRPVDLVTSLTGFIAVPPGPTMPTLDSEAAGEDEVQEATGALAQARSLADKHPGSVTALARLARCELDFEHRVSAMNAASAVVASHDASDAVALLVAAQVLAAVGDTRSAEEALSFVLASDSTGEGARCAALVMSADIAARHGHLDTAMAYLQQVGDNRHEARALEGAILVRLGRYHDAIRVLRAALRDIPDTPQALCNLGFAYAAVGSVRKSTRAMKAAASLAPTDRTAVMNLAALLLSQDETAEALSVVDRLAGAHPEDVRLEFAAAEIVHASGDRCGALRRLQQLKASGRMRTAPPERRAELDLDILLLSGQAKTSAAVFTHTVKALKSCDYRSETIARMLASAAQSTAMLPELEAAYAELSERHNRETLLAVEAQVAFLRFEFDRSLTAAIEWTRHEPFSMDAHISATYLLCMHAGDYEAAARIGQDGIRRGLRSPVLRCNVAFALAMSSDPDKAARVLPDGLDLEPARATAGLIEVVRGNADQGIQMYDNCAQATRRRGDHDLADLIESHRLLAEIMAGRTITEERLARLAARSSTDPRFKVLHRHHRTGEIARGYNGTDAVMIEPTH